MPTLTVRRMAVPAAALIAAGGLVGLTTGSAAADDSGVPIPGSHPAWATAANDAGTAPAAEPVLGQIVLKLRDRAGAQQLALAVATPGSAAYRRYVTPRQWIDRFSPDAARYASLVARLRRQGLTITGTPESRLYVTFTGTADQVAAAFDTSLHRYRRHGSVSTAPMASAKLPASIAADVSSLDISQPVAHLHPASYQPGVSGPRRVDVSVARVRPTTSPAPPTTASTTSGSLSAYGKRSFPTVLCGYEPKQIRSAYGADGLVSKGIDGRGLTIAFTDAFASPTLRADVNTFSAARGEPAVSLQQIVPDPSDYAEYDACGGEEGWQVEQTLDAVALHDVAPKASLALCGCSRLRRRIRGRAVDDSRPAPGRCGLEQLGSTRRSGERRRLRARSGGGHRQPVAPSRRRGDRPLLLLRRRGRRHGPGRCDGAVVPGVAAVGHRGRGHVRRHRRAGATSRWRPVGVQPSTRSCPTSTATSATSTRCLGRSSSAGPAAGRAPGGRAGRTRRMSCRRGCQVANEPSPTSRPSPTATPACSSASATSTPAVRRHRRELCGGARGWHVGRDSSRRWTLAALSEQSSGQTIGFLNPALYALAGCERRRHEGRPADCSTDWPGLRLR